MPIRRNSPESFPAQESVGSPEGSYKTEGNPPSQGLTSPLTIYHSTPARLSQGLGIETMIPNPDGDDHLESNGTTGTRTVQPVLPRQRRIEVEARQENLHTTFRSADMKDKSHQSHHETLSQNVIDAQDTVRALTARAVENPAILERIEEVSVFSTDETLNLGDVSKARIRRDSKGTGGEHRLSDVGIYTRMRRPEQVDVFHAPADTSGEGGLRVHGYSQEDDENVESEKQSFFAHDSNQESEANHYPLLQSKAVPNKIASIPAFMGKRFGRTSQGLPDETLKNSKIRSAVLSQETIWCTDPSIKFYPQANWPCPNEQVWEGDLRMSTEVGQFGRMMPMPRLPKGWPRYHPDYKENGNVPPFPFDVVFRVPNHEDVIAPVDEVPDEVASHMLPRALDSFLEVETTEEADPLVFHCDPAISDTADLVYNTDPTRLWDGRIDEHVQNFLRDSGRVYTGIFGAPPYVIEGRERWAMGLNPFPPKPVRTQTRRLQNPH